MTNTTELTFNIEKLEAAIKEMNIMPKKDYEYYGTKEAYIDHIGDYIEYEIVQPLEREAAAEAGIEYFDAGECTNIDEARDFVGDIISNIKCDLELD